jgi:hypothetical protein
LKQVTESLEASRYDFVARDIKHTLEKTLTLGLPLDQIENADDILARQALLDPAITRIETFAADGTVLSATISVDRRFAEHLLQGGSAEGNSSGPAPPQTFNSRPIVNDFGQAVGGVVVHRSQALAQARNEAILRTLMVAATGATLAGVCIVALGSSRLSRDVRDRLRATAAALRAALRGARLESADGSELANAAAGALAKLDTVEAEVDAALTRENSA